MIFDPGKFTVPKVNPLPAFLLLDDGYDVVVGAQKIIERKRTYDIRKDKYRRKK